MKTIKILIGLPRSGKSTWLKNNKNNEVVVSADDLRYLVYNQRFWSEGESLVWSLRGIFLKYLLQQGVDIIIDETNTTQKARKNIIDLAKKYDYYITGIVIEVLPDECIKRAKETDQYDLIPVIYHMAENYENPDVSEGFDKIEHINKTTNKIADWLVWGGWAGNHNKRIEDTICSNCGFKHPTVYETTRNLYKYCPNCNSEMKIKEY